MPTMLPRCRPFCFLAIPLVALALLPLSELAADDRAAPASEPSALNAKAADKANDAADAAIPSETRQLARLLHETMHATLQAVHHEYYREDEGLKIPAATLQKVFHELATRQNVQLRWLAVDAQAMNADNRPNTEFEKQAVKALTQGKTEFEQVDGGIYRHVGVITLTSDCLKCHAPTRTSNLDRKAGLVIAIPLSAADNSSAR